MPATNRGPWAGQSSTTGTGTGEPEGTGASSSGAPAAGPGTGEPGSTQTGSTGAESNAEGSAGTGEGDGPGDQSRREADLRQRVKAAEEASTADRALVERLQAAEATRLAGAHLANADDLWAVGKVAVADVLAEDGSVDADKVKAAAEKLIADRGDHFSANVRRFPAQHGAGGGTNSDRSGSKAQTGGQRLSETSRTQGVGKRAVESSGTRNPGTHRLTG